MNILISACLAGKKVRYDGNDKSLENLALLSRYHTLHPLCPEVTGGLSVPRNPSEIRGNSFDILNKSEGAVMSIADEDLTEYFLDGAGKVLSYCKEKGITCAILKDGSPSCGSTYVYDGRFKGKKIQGRGITAELLMENGIKVFNEHNFMELIMEECEYTLCSDVE